MGKSTISMVIFNSYVKLPEGSPKFDVRTSPMRPCHHNGRGGPSSIRGAVQELQFCLGHPLSSGTLCHDVYNCHQFSINSIWCSTMFIIFHHVCTWSIFTLNFEYLPPPVWLAAIWVRGCFPGHGSSPPNVSKILACSLVPAPGSRPLSGESHDCYGCGEKIVIPNTSQYNSSIAIFMGNDYHLASNLGIPNVQTNTQFGKRTGMWSFSSISGKSSEKTITPSLSWQAKLDPRVGCVHRELLMSDCAQSISIAKAFSSKWILFRELLDLWDTLGYLRGFYRSDISSPQDMPRMCSNFVFNTSRDQTLDLSSSRCPDQKSWRALEDESFRSSLASWFLTWGTGDSSADAEGSEGAKPLVSQGWRMVDRKMPNGFRIANGLSHPTCKVYKNMKNNRLKRQDHPWNGKHQQLEASHLATPSANSCKPWGQWNEQNKLYLCIWWFQAIPNMFWLVGIISNHHPNSLCLENTRPLKLKPPTRHWLLLISKLTLKSNCRPSQAFTHQKC